MEHIAKYADFFHDGAVMDVEHIGNNITLSISSAEMDKNDSIKKHFYQTTTAYKEDSILRG